MNSIILEKTICCVGPTVVTKMVDLVRGDRK